MATKGQAERRGTIRSIAGLLVVLAGLLAYVVVNDLKPRQGLDLRGGTSVILIPDPSKGQPTRGSLNKAVDIIRQRVDGTGVSEAEVVVEGGNIRVALPDVGRDDALRLVGTTAELTFRHVEQTGAGVPVPDAPAPTGSPSPTASRRPASPRPTPSATANRRPVPAALLGAQASGSPSASPTRPASPGSTARPSPTGTPIVPEGRELTAADAPRIFASVDCTSDEQRNIGQRFAADAEKIVACDVTGTVKYLLGPPEMKGTDVKGATATIDTSQGGTGQWLVELNFTGAGTRKFAQLTQKYVSQQIAIVLDGVVQSAPDVEQAITGGQAQITGNFTAREAKDLANVLKYGSLPIVFDQSEGQTQTISPTLGKESLDAGLLAGLLGLGLVVLYSLLYYRALGLVTVAGLSIFAAFNYLLIVILGQAIGFTLTLAGIAGLIVSIGISADSYVVFYERLKDEAREGKSLRQSVDRGFQRAFQTLLAADFVSLLAAATLYVLSVGGVRGFAFTLGMATILDVVIAYFFTRPVVMLLARSRVFAEGRFVGIRAAASLTSPKEA